VIGAVARHLLSDRTTHDVTRQKFVDELLASFVAKDRPVAPESLGKERAREHRRDEGRRMELHELHVGNRHAGAKCDGKSIGCGLRRIRRHVEELTRAPGRKDDHPRSDAPDRAFVIDVSKTDTPSVLEEQITDEAALKDGHVALSQRDDDGASDLCSRRDTPGVHDSRDRVSTFAGELERSVARAIEIRSPSSEVGDAPRTFFYKDPGRGFVAKTRAGAHGVGKVEIERVILERGDRRYSSLRPTSCRLTQVRLRHKPDARASLLIEVQCDSTSRDPASHNENVEMQ